MTTVHLTHYIYTASPDSPPPHPTRLLVVDYDHTLVAPKEDRRFPKDVDDWRWYRPNVPDVVRHHIERGYLLVIVTNQSKMWKHTQIRTVVDELSEALAEPTPIITLVATDRAYHKPDRRAFDTLLAFLGVSSKEWPSIAQRSIFVGDALGRAADWSDTDRLFAERIGITDIRAPEVFFATSDTVKSAPRLSPRVGPELVIMVGYPGSGKSTIARHFVEAGYVIVSGDELKVAPKIRAAMLKALRSSANPHVVIDATNPTRERRALYADAAKAAVPGIHIRIVHLLTDMQTSVERNNARAKGVPMIAYHVYKKAFEEPTSEEGEVVRVT